MMGRRALCGRPLRHASDVEEGAEREAEREMIQEQAAPILTEVKTLRAEVAAMRAELAGQVAKAGGDDTQKNRCAHVRKCFESFRPCAW